jgi:hypothetical protein
LLFENDFKDCSVSLNVGVFDWDKVINEEIGRCDVSNLPRCQDEDWVVCSW